MLDPTDTVTQALPEVEPRWLALLKEAVASVKGRGGVLQAAQRMGVSRPYVARVLMTGKGRIEQPSPKFIGRVIEAYGQGRVECPHLARDIAKGQCQAYAALEWKVIHGSGPEKVLHWRACQHCPQNPKHQASAAPALNPQTDVKETPCQ